MNFFDKLRRLSQREGDAASAFIQKQCPQTILPLMQESHNHPPRRQHPSAVLFHPLFDISRKSSIIKIEIRIYRAESRHQHAKTRDSIMPIRIPNDLPAASALRSENIFVMTDTRAKTQDIRPLKILLLNLMPTKIATETQLARLLGNTPIQVELELLMVKSHVAKNTSEEHMLAFYKTFDQVCGKTYDGMVITGAPVERMAFEDVEYWDELCAIFEWTKTHVTSTFHICWGAQAGLYYHWGVPKYMMEKKLSGVYRHRVVHKNSILFRGFDDTFMVPHSRYTTVRREDILAHPEMKILAESDEAGVYAISTHGGRQIFITGHSEYDADTLEKEYLRDKAAGLHPDVPCNYYPDDDDTRAPICSWRSSANLLYCNWLNYFVYQATPYDLNSVGIVVMDDFKEQHE